MSDEQDKDFHGAQKAQASQAGHEARQDSEAKALPGGGADWIGSPEAVNRAQSKDAVLDFPPRFPMELALACDLKAIAYKYAGRLSVAQVIGCFAIALSEIREEQP